MTNESGKARKARNVWKWALPLVGVLALVAIGFCAQHISNANAPPIADGIDCKGPQDCEKASVAFNVVIHRRFPLGTPENVLRTMLATQGFTEAVTDIKTCTPEGQSGVVGQMMIYCPTWDRNWNPRNLLEYAWGDIACNRVAHVQWSSNYEGKIKHIEGGIYYACL